MPLGRIIHSLNGTCRYCGQQTGLIRRGHPECRQTHRTGIQEMTQLVAQAAGTASFN